MISEIFVVIQHEFYSGGVSTQYIGYADSRDEAERFCEYRKEFLDKYRSHTYEYEVVEVDPI